VAAVELTVVFDELEAARIRGVLHAEGIESFLKRTDLSAVASLGGGGAGPYAIWVDEADVERARELV